MSSGRISNEQLVALPKVFERLALPKPVNYKLVSCVVHGLYPKKKPGISKIQNAADDGRWDRYARHCASGL